MVGNRQVVQRSLHYTRRLIQVQVLLLFRFALGIYYDLA